MKYLSTVLVTWLIANAGFVQNLVPNGSFEEYLICPDLDSGYFVDCATGWFSPGVSSPDYFNSCSQQLDIYGDPSMSTPLNGHGYQQPHSGQAYAGLFTILNDNSGGVYEYVSVKLAQPLEANRCYRLEYYVSLADSMWWNSGIPNLQYFDSFGGAVSQNSPEELYNGVPYTARYTWPVQVQSQPGVFFSDSLGWQKVEGIFAASGGESYLTVGCFGTWETVQSNYYHAQASIIETYYYIDDISLTALDSFAFILPEISNVFTPDGDGINDVFNVKTAAKGSAVILNRWGETVFGSALPFSWDGTSGNRPCSEGVYFYIIESGNERKTGTVSLIR